jgi:hypothetical protein
VVTPLLKKEGIDANDPANYRPISNLNTISKILERLFLARLASHVRSTTSFNPFQSAYRCLHSTETVLNKIMNDAYEAFDSGRATVLVALDLSAAFDTIDHNTLVERLHHTFGVSGAALDWLRSYLENRRSCVRWGTRCTSQTRCCTGVPQGSVLGPLLFTLYIAPMVNVLHPFDVCHHQYADDTQLYISVRKRGPAANKDVGLLERCTYAVHSWLAHNGLALNPSKSDVIWLTGGHVRQPQDFTAAVDIAGAMIKPSSTIKSLGVTLDSRISFDEHVAAVCKACYFHIRALRHIRASLPDDVAKTIACSIVGSRLDYCNSLFVGMPDRNFHKLQMVQNTLARVVTGHRKFDHVSPILKELHWLPVRKRVTFKIATLVFKARHTGEPQYLASLIPAYRPGRDLRSSTQGLINRRFVRTTTASRAFSCAGAAVWNNLPSAVCDCKNIDTFKKRLKTHLFDC